MPQNIDDAEARERARREPDPVAYGSPSVRREGSGRSNLAAGIMIVLGLLVLAALLLVFIWRGT